MRLITYHFVKVGFVHFAFLISEVSIEMCPSIRNVEQFRKETARKHDAGI